MKIFVLGLSHKTAPVSVRERFAIPAGDCGRHLQGLMALREIAEAVLVSTCNRLEIYGACRDPVVGGAVASRWLATENNVEADSLSTHLYTWEGLDAVVHGFRVAASLDSLVVGEAQILGQMKQAYREAQTAKSSGPVLNKFFHQAFQTAKRVRTETEVARNPVSVASAAVLLARRIFGSLQGHTGLLVGAGEMCELAARHLVAQGVRIVVVNRTLARAQALADSFDGEAQPLEALGSILHQADILIASTGADTYLVQASMVQAALKRRRQRPQFYIDIAVPRDLDPEIGNVDNAYLYDIDDLARIVSENQKDRGRAITDAEAIIAETAPLFIQWLDGLEVVPTLVALRHKLEAMRDLELAKALAGWPNLAEEDRKRVELLLRLLVNKILHPPLSRLRQLSAGEDGGLYVDATRKLFELD